MIDIWTPDRGDAKPNLCKCRQSVTCGGNWRTYQCSRRANNHEEHEGQTYGFCAQHAPSAVAKRAAERQAEWDRKNAASQAGYDKARKEREANAAARKALQAIANGHHEPCRLAFETLKLYPT